MKSVYIVVIGILGFGFVCYLFGRQTTSPIKSAAVQRSDGERSPLETAVSNLTRALERVELRLGALEAKQAPQPEATQNPVGTAPSESLNTGPDVEEIRDRDSKKNAEIERRLKTESRDRVWAAEAEDQIRKFTKEASGENQRLTITSISCLTSICKAEISTPNPAGSGALLRAYALNFPQMAGVETSEPVKAADGSYNLSYRFFRRGYAVPGQEQALYQPRSNR